MKKIAVFGVGVLGIFLVAAPGSAANPPAGAPSVVQPVGPMSGLMVMNPFKLVSLTRIAPDATGHFQLDVAVENITASAKPLEFRIGGVGTSETEKVPSVAAHATQHFTVVDKHGGPTTCGLLQQAEYSIQIGENAGSLATHKAVLHSQGCTFKTQVVNPWDQYTPDHVEAIKKDSLYVDPVQVEVQPSCSGNGTMKLKVSVANHTPIPQNNLRAVLTENGGQTGATPSFNLAKGASASHTITPSVNIRSVGAIAIEGGGAGTYNAGIYVKVNSTCNWSTEIDPPTSAPSSVPR